MKILPKTRTENIVVQTLGAETLVYDLITHKAYNLNETSAIVFNACDGKTSFDQLKSQHKFTDDLVYLALDELKANNLIAGEFTSKFAGVSRREAIRRVGLATMLALPVVSSLTAPLAVHAQSAAANVCAANNCVDGNIDCNAGAPCSGLGAGFVCCFALGSCSCAPANVCTDNGGTICA